MTISLDASNALEAAIDAKIKKAATPRRRASGTVSRVDRDGTVYAVLESGIETVVEGLTASVSPGDTVNVTIEGGRAEVLGNYTDPSAGVKYVRAVEGIAQEAGATAHTAVDSAAAARQVADEAQKVAEATNQHFFADDNGAHITDVTQDEWSAAVDDNFSDYDPDTKPYHNQLLNSLGILLRTALNNLVSITRSAIAFYDGLGNTAANIVARFGADGAQIGKTDASHLTLGEDNLSITNAEKIAMFDVDMDSGSMDAYVDTPNKYTKHDFVTIESPGSYVFTSTDTSDPIEWDGTLTILGSSSVNTAGSRLFRFGLNPSDVSYIGQYNATATDGIYFKGDMPGYPPPSEDFNINARDALCVNENDLEFEYGTAKTVTLSATGYQKLTGSSYEVNFALSATISYGGGNTLTAQYRLELQVVSMGNLPLILRWYSWFPSTRRIVPTNGAAMTFGTRDTVADVGLLSATFGEGLIAAKPHQAVFGKFNVEDTNDVYALIIGNGTADNARSNAFAVTWSGAADLSHTLTTDTFTQAYTAAANSLSGVIVIDVSKTGYTPIGIVGFACGSSGAAMEQAVLDGTDAKLYIRNVTSNAISKNCTVNVLYMAVV